MKGLSPGEISLIISSGATVVLLIFGASLHFSHASSAQQAPSAQCGLHMSLDGSMLFVWSQEPAAYKVLINGTQVWPCPKCIERGYLGV